MEEPSYTHLKNIYIPQFTFYNKDKFPGYKFVKTMEAGGSFGHILYGNGHHYLCLRRGDDISCDPPFWPEPFGYKRKTLKECEDLANEYESVYKNETKYYYVKKSIDTQRPLSINHHKSRKKNIGLYFTHKETGKNIMFYSFRQIASELRLGSETVRHAVNKRDVSVGEYIIVYPTTEIV